MIDSVTAQKIKDTADIVEVVSDYVHLIRRGANYMGLCPFHNERTPSFSVNKRKNFCFCFSCKKGGSPVNFIMQKEGLSYHDALLHLAKKYGIEVQERELTDEERQQQSEREAMLVANEWAMQKMERDLWESTEGRDIGLQYLYQRGVTDEAIRKFHLGYSLDKPNVLTSAAKAAGYDIEVLRKLGLTGVSQQGSEYDRFRGRVIFPIFNSAGKVIGFGGRDLKGGPAKYVNSPESEIYKKSNELYGIYQARPDIVKEDKCYLVEGYLDVIGMWQSGMRNVVASSGTALTDGQIALIHRFTENITLIYDGDAAGIKASLRGIDMLLSHKMKVKVLLLPDGNDPDSFARKHTPEEFRQFVVEHETDIIRFKAQVLLKDIQNDPQRRISAINSVVESLAHIPDPVSRDIYIQDCSGILGISEDTIAKSVARARGSLADKWKRDRARKEFPVPEQNEGPGKAAPSDAAEVSQQPSGLNQQVKSSQLSVRRSGRVPVQIESPVYALEKKVLEYCVKFGYLNFCMGVDDNGNDVPMNVVDFVNIELEADDMKFSDPILDKVYSGVRSVGADFLAALQRREEEVANEVERRRKEGIATIASSPEYTVYDIQKAEKRLEMELRDYQETSIAEFSRDFASRVLASHEDMDIRDTVTELIQEKHQLSHIYSRDGAVVEREEDRLEVLVPRALTEWKNELLNMKLRGLMDSLKELTAHPSEETPTHVHEIQVEINALMKLRSQVAKEIGERIVSPLRGRHFGNRR